MTVRLLCAYSIYPANAIVSLGAGTEAGLVAAKMASTNTAGGTVYVPPVQPNQLRTASLVIDPAGNVLGLAGPNNTIIALGGGTPVPTAPGQPTKPVLTALAGAVSLAWTPGAAGSTATTGSVWTDTNGTVTQLTTNPQVISGLTPGTPYTGTVTTRNAQGPGPASAQADPVTPTAQPFPTSMRSLYDAVWGSSSFATQVGMQDAARESILFRNETTMVAQFIMSSLANNNYSQPTGTWVDIPAMTQVLVTDPGKPYIRGKAFAITSITSDGTTATVTTAAAHGRSTGDSLRIQDATPAGYNGSFPNITVTGANTFTYPLAGALASTTVPGTWAGRPLFGFTVQTKATK